MHDDVTGDAANYKPGGPRNIAERVAEDEPGARQAKAPTAAQLENPYHRIFTRTPSLEALARRAYEAEKRAVGQTAEEILGKNEKNALHDG